MSNIWIVSDCESLECDGGEKGRLGKLADALASRGHKINYWSSTFDHAHRRARFKKDTVYAVSDTYCLRLLKAPRYFFKISPLRLRHEKAVAKKFYDQAPSLERPDLVIAAMPTVELTSAAVKFAKEYGAAAAIDVEGLWPDIYPAFAPSFLRGAAMRLANKQRIELRAAMEQAEAVYAMSDCLMDHAHRIMERGDAASDRVFHKGYTLPAFSEAPYLYWFDNFGVSSGDFICCYVGGVNDGSDFAPVIDAAKLLEAEKGIKFVLCITGGDAASLTAASANLSNLVVAQNVSRGEIEALKKIASVGLMARRDVFNYETDAPDAFCDYISSGLIVMESRDGALYNTIRKNAVGDRYYGGDDLAKKVLEMAHSRTALGAVKERSRKLFEDEYDCKKVYDRFADAIEDVIGKGGAE